MQEEATHRLESVRPLCGWSVLEMPGRQSVEAHVVWVVGVAFLCKLQCPMVRACLCLTVELREQVWARGRCLKQFCALPCMARSRPRLLNSLLQQAEPRAPCSGRLASTANACEMLGTRPVGLSARRDPRPLSKPFIASFNGSRLHLPLRAEGSRFGSVEAIFHPR